MPNAEIFGAIPEMENEARVFDARGVSQIDRGYVEKTEDRKSNVYPIKAVHLAGAETARAQVLADQNNEVRPARVHTPNPNDLVGLSDDSDRYPGAKKEMPDMGIDDPENFLN